MRTAAEHPRLVRISSLKTAAGLRAHAASLKIEIPCDDHILAAADSPLAWPVAGLTLHGKSLKNRLAVQPMEGWDATTTGQITDDVRRRWRRFGESGAALICGGEAMAVRADGRANPNQLIMSQANAKGLAELRQILVRAHEERYGKADDVVIGFQLTHSGRFCRPHDHHRLEPRVAYRHPLLDAKFGVTSDAQVFTDTQIEELIQAYIEAARVANEVGADFVDLKHCHGYLLHEFLSAFDRPGQYGGSFENRTRILREIIQGIRASGNSIDLAVRLSAFDSVPFRPDPARSSPGRPGPGVPEDFSSYLPYRYGFGLDQSHPLERDLTETCQLAKLCLDWGVKLLNLSAGSPYYTPHLLRPAAYPPSDGYLPPEDPLVGVARQMDTVRKVRAFLDQPPVDPPNELGKFGAQSAGKTLPQRMLLVGSAYSYLQEYLPQVAQAALRHGWTDMIGIGRMVLSYPGVMADALNHRALSPKLICRTFSDCTTAPRNGLVSGCYPLDSHYAKRPEAQTLKALKRSS